MAVAEKMTLNYTSLQVHCKVYGFIWICCMNVYVDMHTYTVLCTCTVQLLQYMYVCTVFGTYLCTYISMYVHMYVHVCVYEYP